MKKSLKLFFGILLSVLFISCGSSDEKIVKKYLPGTYTRQHKEGESIGFGYNKELTIKHLKGNEYRITCLGNDRHYSNGEVETLTPDTYDFEISSIELTQKSDSIAEYYIRGFVTEIIGNGTTISYADFKMNHSGGITLIVGKNIVEVKISGTGLSSIRKK